MPASLSGQFQTQGAQALQGATAWAEDTNRNGGLHVRDLNTTLPLTNSSTTTTAAAQPKYA